MIRAASSSPARRRRRAVPAVTDSSVAVVDGAGGIGAPVRPFVLGTGARSVTSSRGSGPVRSTTAAGEVSSIIGAPGSGPVAFVNGTPSSALTWTYSALGNLADDLEFSNDDGATWNYVPVPDVTGVDAAVTDIRMRPKGLMPGQGTGSPNFQLQFRVRVN